MYEQYTDEQIIELLIHTDKQIVEMLMPKLNESIPEYNWYKRMEHNELDNILIKVVGLVYRLAYFRGQSGRSFIIGEKKADEKKAKESVNTFQVEDKVKLITKNGIDENNRFFPPIGTIGKVVELSSGYCFIQWPNGATYSNGALSCPYSFLEKVTEHWVPATKDNVKVGSKVCYLNAEKHKQNPEFYPSQGTIGKVVSVVADNTYLVQWPDYTTAWFVNRPDLEVLLCE